MFSQSERLTFLESSWAQHSAYVFSLFFLLLIFITAKNFYIIFSSHTTTVNRNPELMVHKTFTLPDIASWHLLGNYQPKLFDPSSLPQASLNYFLRGTFLVVPRKASEAVIADAQGMQKLYKTGDQLPDGTKIFKILSDAVVIKRKDELEVLSLPKDNVNFNKPLGFSSTIRKS